MVERHAYIDIQIRSWMFCTESIEEVIRELPSRSGERGHTSVPGCRDCLWFAEDIIQRSRDTIEVSFLVDVELFLRLFFAFPNFGFFFFFFFFFNLSTGRIVIAPLVTRYTREAHIGTRR
jgi:hypothetical protein